MRVLVRRLHLILAFVFGLPVVISGLTGSALVFRDEIDRLLNPDLLRVPPREAPFRLEEALAAASERFPGEPIRFVRLAREPGDTYEIWTGSEEYRRVYVDPYEAVVLGFRTEHDGVMGVMFGLHETFLAGGIGGTVNGIAGLGLLVLAVSGLVLWWPRGRWGLDAFRVRWRATRLKLHYDLHRLAGIVSCALLFLAALTGVALVFHRVAAFLLIAALGGPALGGMPELQEPWARPALPVERLLDRAREAMPDAEATWIRPPGSPTAPFLARLRFPENPHPNGSSYVALRPDDGRAVAIHSYRAAGTGQVVADYRYPLHIGTALGLPGRMLMFAAGLAPALLLVTGLVFWLTRRRRRRAREGAAVATG